MNTLPFEIVHICQIRNSFVAIDQKKTNFPHPSKINIINYLSEIYNHFQIQYPKFFKMDKLCKAGFLAGELLLQNYDFDRENGKSDWGIILCNESSSDDNDQHYWQTIDKENYYPSPSVFVYTLPNIVTGEIAIRHKIQGESSFFILPELFTKKTDNQIIVNKEKYLDLVSLTYESNPELSHILCGIVEVTDDFVLTEMALTRKVRTEK